MHEFITAILAGFIGALLTRQNQYYNWALMRRSESFPNFLQLINEAFDKSTDILLDGEIKEPSILGIKIFNEYRPMLIQAQIIRFYLPKNIGDEFYNHAKAYYDLHCSTGLGDKRFGIMRTHLEKIQDILEQELSGRDQSKIAKEWLVFITTGFIGFIILPAVIVMIAYGNLYKFGSFYQTLFNYDDREFVICWLFVAAPYVLTQFARLTMWSIKQLRDEKTS
jgi:uncharacterized membrane protein